MKKEALLDLVKKLEVKPAYACYEIANRYGHRIVITPPYHCELQPIEKVWSMAKTPLAYNPDLNETAMKLKAKLEEILKSLPEKSLLSV